MPEPIDNTEKVEHAWSTGVLPPDPAPVSHAALETSDDDLYVASPRRPLFSHWALFAISAISLFFLVQQRDSVTYWLSNTPRIDIGHFSDTHPEMAPSGSWVTVAGIASPVRGTYTRFFTAYELLHLLSSPVIVLRPEGKDVAEYRGYGFRYTGEGRLMRLSDVPELAEVRERFSEKGEIRRDAEVYLLKEGEIPRRGVGPWGAVAIYFFLFAGTLTVGWRRLAAKKSPPKSA